MAESRHLCDVISWTPASLNVREADGSLPARVVVVGVIASERRSMWSERVVVVLCLQLLVVISSVEFRIQGRGEIDNEFRICDVFHLCFECNGRHGSPIRP